MLFTISRLCSIFSELGGPFLTQHHEPAQCFYPAGTGLGFFVDVVNDAAIPFFLARSLPVQFAGPTAREQMQSAQYKI